jgi:hypothetical protein
MLSGVTHMLVLQGYGGDAADTLGWVHQEEVGDFRQNDRYQSGGFSNLSKLGKNGHTAKILNPEDPVKESYAIERFAGQVIFDERFIYDSASFGMAEQSAEEIGRRAREIPIGLVYSQLLLNGNMSDGGAFFNTTRGNLLSLALTGANLDLLAQALSSMKGANGMPTNVAGATLLTSGSLGYEATKMIASAELRNSSGEHGTSNPNYGRFDVIVENRLSNGVVNPDNETLVAARPNRWYLVGPSSMRACELGWLVGTGRQPRVRRTPLAQGAWGVHLDIVIDCGAKMISPQAMAASDQP